MKMTITKVARYDKDMICFDIMEGSELTAHIILAKDGTYSASGAVPIKFDEKGRPVIDKNGNYGLPDDLLETADFIWSHITE